MRRGLGSLWVLTASALSGCVLLSPSDRDAWYQRARLGFEPVWAAGQEASLEGAGSFWLTVQGEGWSEDYELAWEPGADRIVADAVSLPDEPVRFLLQGYSGLVRDDEYLLFRGATPPEVVEGGAQHELQLYLAQAGESVVFSAPPSFGAALASDGAGTFYAFGGTGWGAESVSEARAWDGIMAWSLGRPAQNLAWVSAGSLGDASEDTGHDGGAAAMQLTATLLEHGDHAATGSILLTGGWEAFQDSGSVRADIRLYDPQSGLAVAAGQLWEPRAGHAAFELEDGWVLVAGGWAWAEAGELACARTVEIWNPYEREVVAASDELEHCLEGGAGAVVGDAVVWCGGLRLEEDGYGAEGGCWLLHEDASVTAIDAPFPEKLGLLLPAMAPLEGERALLVGGALVEGTLPQWGLGGQWAEAQSKSWLYDRAWGGWKATVGDLQIPRLAHAAVALPGGGVLVAGGAESATNAGVNVIEPSPCAELWDLAGNGWELLQPCVGDEGALHGAVHRPSVAVDPLYGALVRGGLEALQSASGMTSYMPAP